MHGIQAGRSFVLAVGLAACGSSHADLPQTPPPTAVPSSAGDGWVGEPTFATAFATATPPSTAPSVAGKDFAEEAKILFRVAACAGDAPLPPTLELY